MQSAWSAGTLTKPSVPSGTVLTALASLPQRPGGREQRIAHLGDENCQLNGDLSSRTEDSARIMWSRHIMANRAAREARASPPCCSFSILTAPTRVVSRRLGRLGLLATSLRVLRFTVMSLKRCAMCVGDHNVPGERER